LVDGTQVGRSECEEGLGLARGLHELYFDPILTVELHDGSKIASTQAVFGGVVSEDDGI
jgi:hypothetical protein